MKHLLSTLLIVAATAAVHAGTVVHSVTFDASGWSVGTVDVGGTQYATVGYSGIDANGEPGAPELPVKHLRLLVPYNATNISVTATYGAATTETLTHKVLPAEQPQIADENAVAPVIEEDSAIYYTNAPFPASLAEVVSEGFFMGENHIITVALHPVQYNPVTGVLTRYSSITATVHYDTGTADGILFSRNALARSKDQAMLATMVDNPTSIATFSPTMTGPSLAPGSNAGSELEHYEYTVITTRDLAPAYKRLIALKRQKGYTAGVVCVEDLMNNPLVNGGDSIVNSVGNLVSVIADSAGVIRQYLRRVQPLGTRYVLMGARQVPFRYGYQNPNSAYRSWIPTDWYYSDINTDWVNSNGQYYTVRFWPKFDYYADLYIGRLMAETSQDVSNYTDKLLRYELNPGNGDTAYLDSVLVVKGAENLDPTNDIAQSYIDNNFGVRHVEQTRDHLFPTGEYVINQMKNYGIHSIHGHGSPYSVSVNDYLNEGSLSEHTTFQHIRSLTMYDEEPNNGFELMQNKYHPAVNYSWSCSNIPFDVYYNIKNQVPFYYTGSNMGQSYTLGKDYGGVAYFGNTRDGYASYKRYEQTFIRNLSNTYKAGEIESYTKQTATSNHFVLIHNLMGDPEFSIWTHAPEGIGNIAVSCTDNSISINGIAEILGKTTIGYCDNVSSGMISRPIANGELAGVSPNSIVMVYRHNAYPYISPLRLQNCEITRSQYVFVPSATIGRSIDENRTPGDVVIKENVDYELETKNGIVITPGLTVEKGASFSVEISKDFYLR